MNYETLEAFRRRLLGRRSQLLRRRRVLLAGESELRAEREPDWEDAAAAETAASTLESLSESERAELGRIAATLARMERGSYGTCANCLGPIDFARLAAVPDTDRCARCAVTD
jgi:RNA polymerase-binding transcription factor DksA